ncbi:hypothetical protein [Brevibacillus choshinensis]|nr:hypothetical protein [Brevibacillus choshinensis]
MKKKNVRAKRRNWNNWNNGNNGNNSRTFRITLRPGDRLVVTVRNDD